MHAYYYWKTKIKNHIFVVATTKGKGLNAIAINHINSPLNHTGSNCIIRILQWLCCAVAVFWFTPVHQQHVLHISLECKICKPDRNLINITAHNSVLLNSLLKFSMDA